MIIEKISDITLKQAKWVPSITITVLLDTNVLIYSKRPDFNAQIMAHLNHLQSVGKPKKLAISQASIYEMIAGCNPSELKEIEIILSQYPSIPIGKETQLISALLRNFYAERGVSVSHISLADFYIAATSVLAICPIITANESDFPPCMFEEYNTFQISWKENGRAKNITLHLLYPLFETYFAIQGEKELKPSHKTLIEAIIEHGPKTDKRVMR